MSKSYLKRQYHIHKMATHRHYARANRAERHKQWDRALLYYHKALQSRQAADSCWSQLYFGQSDVGHAQMALNIAKKIVKVQKRLTYDPALFG